MRTLPALLLLIPTLLLPGCASEPEPEPWPPAPGVPLELDPTERIEIGAWWANDDALLHLDDDLSFVRWNGLNRHASSVDRGRWSRRSYAALELESYRTREPLRVRVILTRDDRGLALNVPGLDPLRPLAGPPVAPEDRLVGRYAGARAQLELGDDGSFLLEPTGEGHAPTDAPAHVAARRGRWVLSGETLVLLPEGGDRRERIILDVMLDAALGAAPDADADAVVLDHAELGPLERLPDEPGPVS